MIGIVLIIAGALLVAFGLWAHWHGWQAVSAECSTIAAQEDEFGYAKLKENVGVPRTRILYKCSSCEAVKVVMLSGHWTLAEVRGETKEGVKLPWLTK